MSLESISAAKNVGRNSEYEGGKSLSQHFGTRSSPNESEAFNSYWDQIATEGRDSQESLEEDSRNTAERRMGHSESPVVESNQSTHSFGFSAMGFASPGFGSGELSSMPQFGRLEASHAKDFGMSEKPSSQPRPENDHDVQARATGAAASENRSQVSESREGDLDVEDDLDEDDIEKKGRAVVAPILPISRNRIGENSDRASAAQAVDPIRSTEGSARNAPQTTEANTLTVPNPVMTQASKAVQAQHGTVAPTAVTSTANGQGNATSQIPTTPVANSAAQAKAVEVTPVVTNQDKASPDLAQAVKPVTDTVLAKPVEGTKAKLPVVETSTTASKQAAPVDVKAPETKSSILGADEAVATDSKKTSESLELGANDKPVSSTARRTASSRAQVAANVQGNSHEGNSNTVKAADTSPTSIQSDGQQIAAKDAAKLSNGMVPGREQSDIGTTRSASRNAPVASQVSPESASRTASTPSAAEAIASESKTSDASSTRAAAAAATTTSRPVSRPVNAGQNTAQTTVGGISAQALNAGVGNTGNASQQQQSSGENSTKQDLAFSMKAATSGKGVEKASGETAQSFSVEAGEETSTRRSQAAVKAQGTSYASKTAEEVKEVYKALSNGIEKMVNLKQETLNVRINFDQGGSMTLKLKMENGQLNTLMQTDLNGLESVIKSNWGDLANDWAQRGVKLNTPQFTQAEGEGKNEFSQSFDSRQNGGTESSSQREGRGGQATQGVSSRGQSSNTANEANSGEANSESNTVDEESSSDSELKAYA